MLGEGESSKLINRVDKLTDNKLGSIHTPDHQHLIREALDRNISLLLLSLVYKFYYMFYLRIKFQAARNREDAE